MRKSPCIITLNNGGVKAPIWLLGEVEVLFSRNIKPEMSGLGIAPKEIFLAYSTKFVFSTIRLVPGNVVIVSIGMCGIRENKCILIFWFFLL